MATDIPALRLKLLDKKAAIEAAVATIDQPAEQTRIDNARAVYEGHEATYKNAQKRWGLVKEMLADLDQVDRQIDVLGP